MNHCIDFNNKLIYLPSQIDFFTKDNNNKLNKCDVKYQKKFKFLELL